LCVLAREMELFVSSFFWTMIMDGDNVPMDGMLTVTARQTVEIAVSSNDGWRCGS